MLRMGWYLFGRDDDRLYVELEPGRFLPFDELPPEMLYSDGKLNVLLNQAVWIDEDHNEFEVPRVIMHCSPGITCMRALLKEGTHKLVRSI